MSCWTKQLRPHNTHAGGVIKRRHTYTHAYMHTCIHTYICVYIRYASTVCIHGADPTGPSCSSGVIGVWPSLPKWLVPRLPLASSRKKKTRQKLTKMCHRPHSHSLARRSLSLVVSHQNDDIHHHSTCHTVSSSTRARLLCILPPLRHLTPCTATETYSVCIFLKGRTIAKNQGNFVLHVKIRSCSGSKHHRQHRCRLSTHSFVFDLPRIRGS